MSYCRFSDDSDVYVFLGTALECGACRMYPQRDLADALEDSDGAERDGPVMGWADSFLSGGPEGMIHHLKQHIVAGHCVPMQVLDRLEGEMTGERYLQV